MAQRFHRLQEAWLRRGALACALWPLSCLYGAVVAVRRFAYQRGWLASRQVDVPVLVVGNLIAGGAGKTPATLAVVALLRRLGWTPGIVSRGYGRQMDEGDAGQPVEVHDDMPARRAGDEPLLLRLRSGAPVVVARDRVAAAQAMCAAHPDVDILVCDDGLQHLRLARDVQLIVFDERGAGNGWLLPAGPLREPLPDRVPARSLVLYNATAPSTPLPGYLARRRLAGAVTLADWWRGEPASPSALQVLRGQRVLALAGVARPQRFFEMLRGQGLDVVEYPLPDHHDFTQPAWQREVQGLLDAHGLRDVLVTEKDAVKLDATAPSLRSWRIWVVALDFAPDSAFDAALAALLPARRAVVA